MRGNMRTERPAAGRVVLLAPARVQVCLLGLEVEAALVSALRTTHWQSVGQALLILVLLVCLTFLLLLLLLLLEAVEVPVVSALVD